MENKKVIKSNVKNLIALCNILDEYEEFKKNLVDLPTKFDSNDIDKLNKISNGKFVLGAKKIKEFYHQNKNVIDKINSYSSIIDFLCTENLDFEESDLNSFYKYILTHRDELDKILSILNVIKIHGFKDLVLDENIDFTNTKYKVGTEFKWNITIPYLNNIQIIPNYQDDIIEYTTTDSDYLIEVRLSSEDYSETERYITVNNLTFDSKSLPKSISNKKIFDRLCYLKEEQKEQCTAIKNSVDLGVSIDDLYSQFNVANKTIKNLNDLENKENMIKILNSIKENLNKLKDEIILYNDNVSEQYPNLTGEELEKAKQKKIERVYWSKRNIS